MILVLVINYLSKQPGMKFHTVPERLNSKVQ